MKLEGLTITNTHQGLVNKEFSALELTKSFLDKIEELDKKISAFLTVIPDLALSEAKKIDDLISQDREIPPLGGLPCAIKDNMLIEGVRCTAASKILENYIASYDATVVKKLRAEGAVFLGKTNLDEFAMGSSTENSGFLPTRNPHDLSRVPGGSSGGSAAAVASGMAIYALGSDTGGSIRLPASFCGVVGLKPTYGAVSRYGLIAMASSLDQIGPITKTVEDAKIVFEAISGHDEKDSTSVNSKFQAPSSKLQIRKLKIGVPREYFIKGMDKDVERLVREAIKKFEGVGAKTQEISLPHTEYALPAYYLIMPSEVSANLARYDGIKYGYSTKNAKDLMEVYSNSREEGFGDEVRRRIMLGTYTLSAGFYEAYYLRAQKVRTRIIEDFNKAFQKVDIILTPVSPAPAFKLGEKKDPLSMYLSDIFMTAVNLVGLPAISVPCGKAGKLPVGLQIIGKPFEENKILKVGEIFEKL
jgi:aspartyl-tRNA(Asn)/glutamyl-tRNA(Gln) amidotransferase subunit A